MIVELVLLLAAAMALLVAVVTHDEEASAVLTILGLVLVLARIGLALVDIAKALE